MIGRVHTPSEDHKSESKDESEEEINTEQAQAMLKKIKSFFFVELLGYFSKRSTGRGNFEPIFNLKKNYAVQTTLESYFKKIEFFTFL